jgi:hypothetical protein
MKPVFLFIMGVLIFSCKRVTPEIVIDFEPLYLESIPHNEELTFTLNITNQGAGVLKILEIEPSCGCVIYLFDAGGFPIEIGPSCEKKLTFQLKVKSFGGFLETIKFATNDPKKSSFLKVVRGKIT